MPRSSSLPAPPSTPRAQRRRVKRGVVAGYIHEISARHGGQEPAAAPVPSPARAAESSASLKAPPATG
jgi:hypothetical protein